VTQTTQPQTIVGTPTTVTSVVSANHNVAKTIDTGDIVTITPSGPLTGSTVCSAWIGAGAQTTSATVTGATGSNNTLTLSAAGCNFGTIDLGSTLYYSSTRNYTSSTLAYSGGTSGNTTLTITVGTGTRSNPVSGSTTLTYNPSPNITTTDGGLVTPGFSTTPQTF
jgi:hypothetical protein